MKAVKIKKNGGPEVLELNKINLEKPNNDEVLIEHVAIGLNYKAHAEETNSDAPKEPIVFNKSPNCIVGPNDNIVIPKNSRVTYIRGIIPANLVFDFAGATTFGFGTTSYNNAGTTEVDEDYFSLSATANAKSAAFYDTLTDFGNVSAAMYTNHLNVSNADSGSGTSSGEIDKELMLVMNIANGATATAGELLVVVNYLQQVNTSN